MGDEFLHPLSQGPSTATDWMSEWMWCYCHHLLINLCSFIFYVLQFKKIPTNVLFWHREIQVFALSQNIIKNWLKLMHLVQIL
jgi:hypothetical protein